MLIVVRRCTTSETLRSRKQGLGESCLLRICEVLSKQKRKRKEGRQQATGTKINRKHIARKNNSCPGLLNAPLFFPSTCLNVRKRSGCYFALIVACICPKLFRCFDQRQFEEIRNPLQNVSKKQEDEAPFLVLSLLQKFPILTSQKHLVFSSEKLIATLLFDCFQLVLSAIGLSNSKV